MLTFIVIIAYAWANFFIWILISCFLRFFNFFLACIFSFYFMIDLISTGLFFTPSEINSTYYLPLVFFLSWNAPDKNPLEMFPFVLLSWANIFYVTFKPYLSFFDLRKLKKSGIVKITWWTIVGWCILWVWWLHFICSFVQEFFVSFFNAKSYTILEWRWGVG